MIAEIKILKSIQEKERKKQKLSKNLKIIKKEILKNLKNKV